jgi:hypothetical protein
MKNVKTLDIGFCSQLSDKAFRYMENVEVLRMSGCSQETICGDGFRYLKNIRSLNVSLCNSYTLQEALMLNPHDLIYTKKKWRF